MHVAGSFDDSVSPAVFKMYVNGQEACSSQTSGIFDSGSELLFLGASDISGANAWNGQVADFKFYSSVGAAVDTVRSVYDQTYTKFFKTPDSISGLVLWLESGSGITQDGFSNISAWASSGSAANNSADQGSPGLEPTFVASRAELNNRPVVRFNGVDQVFDLATTVTDTNEFTRIIVFVDDNTGTVSTYFGASGANLRNEGSSGTNASFRIVDNAAVDETLAIHTQGAGRLVCSQRDSLNKVDIFLDGSAANRIFSDTAQVGDASVSRIGAATDDTNYFQGDIAEVIIFDSAISASDRQEIEVYLQKKYGI